MGGKSSGIVVRLISHMKHLWIHNSCKICIQYKRSEFIFILKKNTCIKYVLGVQTRYLSARNGFDWRYFIFISAGDGWAKNTAMAFCQACVGENSRTNARAEVQCCPRAGFYSNVERRISDAQLLYVGRLRVLILFAGNITWRSPLKGQWDLGFYPE